MAILIKLRKISITYIIGVIYSYVEKSIVSNCTCKWSTEANRSALSTERKIITILARSLSMLIRRYIFCRAEYIQ